MSPDTTSTAAGPPPPAWLANAAHAGAPALLQALHAHLGADATVASSFGAEDVVLLDLVATHAPSLRVFTLDTGRLHPETYEVMEALRVRLGLTIETYAPARDALETLERTRGYFSFRDSVEARKECCGIRKVEPLQRALSGRAAWVTGLRRAQNVTRQDAATVEWDATHGLWKCNPLASWSSTDVWAHIRNRGLPYNRLHDVGFPSIGCAPCTRAVRPYEDERAGRWWWESPDTRECGLHVRR